jgi:hypothetical protein
MYGLLISIRSSIVVQRKLYKMSMFYSIDSFVHVRLKGCPQAQNSSPSGSAVTPRKLCEKFGGMALCPLRVVK